MIGRGTAAHIIVCVRPYILQSLIQLFLPYLLMHIGRDGRSAGIIHARNEFQKNMSHGTLDRNSDVTELWGCEEEEGEEQNRVLLWPCMGLSDLSINIITVKDNVLYVTIFVLLTQFCVKLRSNAPRMFHQGSFSPCLNRPILSLWQDGLLL